MRPPNSASRMTMARAGSVSSVGSSAYEDTPRADLQTNNNAQRKLPPRPVTNGVRVKCFKVVNFNSGKKVFPVLYAIACKKIQPLLECNFRVMLMCSFIIKLF